MEFENIPKHVAIIMDGNGRWAKEKGLPRIAGHNEGMQTIKEIVEVANEIGVEALTLYAFSTENWKRPQPEVQFLMNLPKVFLSKELNNLVKNNIRLNRIGFDEQVPKNTLEVFDKAIEKTKNNTGLILNFAFNYGGRAEIVHAVQNIVKQYENKDITYEQINEDLIQSNLLTNGLTEPDLLVRTSGEIRISNFLLWQIAYSEMIFTDVYFPDFKRNEFLKIIEEYQNRNRRYGGLRA